MRFIPVASGNYARAAHKSSPAYQATILDAQGMVKDEMKPRMRALRLKDVVRDPSVRLTSKGKLAGVTAGPP